MPAGRNDPCPCGSGRKYKQCCLARDEAHAAEDAVEAAPFRGGGPRLPEQVRAAAAAERIWAADAVPLMIGIEEGDAPRPVGLLVTAGDLVIQSDIRGRLRGEPADVAAAIDRVVVAAAREIGAFPEQLYVRHADVAAALAPLLAPRQVVVEAAAVPELEDAATSLMEHVAGQATWPPVCRTDSWRGWELPLPLVGQLFEAAARFYRLAAWRDIANLQAPRVVLPNGREWTCVVLGNGGEEFGLALYSEAADLFDVQMRNTPQQAFAGMRGRILTLSFDTLADAGPVAVREARLHRWEFAGPAAFPMLITVNTPGGGAARADIEDLIALLHAVPAFVQHHRRALRHEDATGEPAGIDWIEPASAIAFRYAGEAVQADQLDREADEDSAESGGGRDTEFHAELGAAIREVEAEIGDDADEATLLDAIERVMQRKTSAYNERPQADFGGLAPAQVTRLLRSDWTEPDGVVQLREDLTFDDVAHSRFIHNARTLVQLAIERDGLGATPAGNLKLDVVNELLERMRLGDDYVADLRAVTRRITEQDVWPMHRIRVVCGVAGLLRRRHARFEPTRRARSLAEPAAAGKLFALLFRTYFRKFNIAFGTRVLWPELQYQIAYTMYRLPAVANDWHTAADMIDDVVLPYAVEQARMRNAPSPDFAAIDLAICGLGPLAEFGLLDRKKALSRRLGDELFRATSLARSAIRFSL